MRFLEQLVSWSIQSGIQSALTVPAIHFFSALRDPLRAQQQRLKNILETIQESEQAKRIPQFSKIRTIQEFQERVPVVDYDSLRADIETIQKGKRNVLTQTEVLRFEKTGGSSGNAKYVPQTSLLLKEFQRALIPWIWDIYTRRPKIKYGPSYWSLSPIGQKQGKTSGGIPVGTLEDSRYFPPFFQKVLAQVLAVPDSLAHFPEIESCRYVTLRYLLEKPHLSFISVWNPSFLTLLWKHFEDHTERLLDDLKQGTCRPPFPDSQTQQLGNSILARLHFQKQPCRAQQLRTQLASKLLPQHIWPQLQLISTWTSANASHFLEPLRQLFPEVEIQGKGLLATEGVTTIPLFEAPAPVLAIQSHFYEFIESETQKIHTLESLQHGKIYEVMLSTCGGFLRYRTGDQVQLVGFLEKTPCFTFLGRNDSVCDLVGEKLLARDLETLIRASFQKILGGAPSFFLVAPELGPPAHYHLFLETCVSSEILRRLQQEIEISLQERYHYGYARKLGQLGPLQYTVIQNGIAQYEQGCLQLGQRAGDIKPVFIHRALNWSARFRTESSF